MSKKFKKTIVLGLDYSEISAGTTEINRKMGLLEAEFGLAKEKVKSYGDEMNELSLRHEYLEQKIILQKKAVEESAKAYDKAMSSGKASEKTIDALDKALLKERTSLEKLNRELKENEKKLEKAEEGSESFGDTIRDVADYLGINASPAVEKFASHFDDVDAKVGQAILTIGTLTTTLGNLTLQTTEQAKEIISTSQTMGMTTEQYQEWDYVLKIIGYDAESASGDLAALGEKAMDAAEGAGEGAELFKKLGIRVKDSNGQIKTQNQLFEETISKLQGMTDETKRNAIASALLSTTGEKLVPVLNMTKQELQLLKQEAHDTGYVMDQETLAGFKGLSKEMEEFKRVGEGLENTFAEALLPMLTALFSALSAIPTPVLQMIITLTTMIATMVSVGRAIGSTFSALDKLTDKMAGLDTKTLKTTAIIVGVVAALIALAAIITVMTGKGEELQNTMDSVGKSVGSINKNIQSVQSGGQPRYNANGTDYFEGGETWVGENGPERVELPRGSKIINNRDSINNSKQITYYYVTIDAKNVTDFNRVVKIFDGIKQSRKKGAVLDA